MLDERLIEIEIKLAHQEVLIDELNQVLRNQQKTIDQLEKAMKILNKRPPENQSGELAPGNEKPPHF